MSLLCACATAAARLSQTSADSPSDLRCAFINLTNETTSGSVGPAGCAGARVRDATGWAAAALPSPEASRRAARMVSAAPSLALMSAIPPVAARSVRQTHKRVEEVHQLLVSEIPFEESRYQEAGEPRDHSELDGSRDPGPRLRRRRSVAQPGPHSATGRSKQADNERDERDKADYSHRRRDVDPHAVEVPGALVGAG